jgi:hypothetical protein
VTDTARSAIAAGAASVGDLFDLRLNVDLLNDSRRGIRRRHQRCCNGQG